MRTSSFRANAAVAAFALYSAGAGLAVPNDENWPQWRGPGGRGVATGTDYADEWSPAKNVAWKAPVDGRGHSSPVIWGTHLFVTTSIKGEHVPGHAAPDHLDFNLKPGYLHPDSEAVDYKGGRGLVRGDEEEPDLCDAQAAGQVVLRVTL